MDDHARAMGCVEQETWEWEMKFLTTEQMAGHVLKVIENADDPVYRIIRACGMSTANSDINVFALERIVEDIKAAEREACAQLCESIAKPEENIYYTAPLIDIAIAAIRARGTE